ncbi:MAG: hypothetical protein JXR76_24905 [Deltaproteobacteria bacterium]|nr:hypothetical protein [Deltaproteobacteria bacterium]
MSILSVEYSANATFSLPAVAYDLLNRQVIRLAAEFAHKGGFTALPYRVRAANRQRDRLSIA